MMDVNDLVAVLFTQLVSLIERNEPHTYSTIVEWWLVLDRRLNVEQHETFYDAIGASCHYENFYREYC